MVLWPDLVFLVVAIVASVFYGTKACEIFEVPSTAKPWSWKIHQFWLNFAGSFVGWLALWTVTPRALTCVRESCTAQFSVSDVALFVLGFIGVTGFLPVVVVGLVFSIKEVVTKLAGLLK